MCVDISAIVSIASSVNSSVTFSVPRSAVYCFIKLLSGSFKIFIKSFFVRAFNSTRIGSRPCSSGNKSDGFASWKAPDAINKM